MNLAKIHHPDYGGEVEKFQKINEAYKYSKKVLLRGKEIVDVRLETEAVLSGWGLKNVIFLIKKYCFFGIKKVCHCMPNFS